MITYLNENLEYDVFRNGEDIISSILNESDIEISYNYINRFLKNFDENYTSFSEEYFIESDNISSKLSKLGLDSSVTIKIDSAVKEIVNTIKVNGVTKETENKIHNIVANLFKNVAKSITNIKPFKGKQFAGLNPDKVAQSFSLLIWVVIIGLLCDGVLALFFSSKVAEAIGTIIIAPLTEEAGKQIALKGGFDKEYYIVFNAMEAGMYINDMTKSGVPLKTAIRVRSFALGGHGIFTLIHKLFDSEAFRKKFNINDEDKEDKATFLSYIITCLLHGSWNTTAVFSRSFVKLIAGVK